MRKTMPAVERFCARSINIDRFIAKTAEPGSR
jgi:hypothetical protein